jgi:hypothetical protein
MPIPGIPEIPAPPTLPPYTPREPFGVTPDVSRFMRPNWKWIEGFKERDPGELAALQSVSDIARLITGQGGGLFNVGSPAYTQALNYYRRLLGGARPAITEAIAPEAQAITDIYKGAERSLEAGPLRGGAREAAGAELARARTGAIAGLPAQARQAAAQAAGGLGLSGAQAGLAAEQAGAGLFGQVLGAEQANRLAAIQAAQAQQGLGLEAALGAARLTLDDLVRSGQLGLEEYRIMTGNNLALGRLTLDQYLGTQDLSLRQKELALREKELQKQRSQQKWGILGSILGTGLSFIPGVGPAGGFASLLGRLFGGGGEGEYTPGFDWPEGVPATGGS